MTDIRTPAALREVAVLFLKLGATAFGGPAAHIAMMENEVVKKRQWMDHGHFLDLVGATNLIPGPNSTEMTMHCGYERAGWKGLFVAGACFILPAVLVTAFLAWAYRKYGHLPEVDAWVYGIKPAVIAVIVSALIPLGKKAMKNAGLWLLAAATLAVCLAGVNEIAALFGCGFAGLLLHVAKNSSGTARGFSPFVLLQIALPAAQAGSLKIFWIFLKIGSLLYGSGYVLFAYLDAELVAQNLLTREQLLDAIAVGQFTPGPVLSTATFIGWQMNGAWGAVAATAGIFLPSFLFVALLNPLIPGLRKSAAMSAFLDAVNAGAVALILAVCVDMGKAALGDWRSVVIALAGFAATFAFKKMNTAFIVLGGSLLGYLLNL